MSWNDNDETRLRRRAEHEAAEHPPALRLIRRLPDRVSAAGAPYRVYRVLVDRPDEGPADPAPPTDAPADPEPPREGDWEFAGRADDGEPS